MKKIYLSGNYLVVEDIASGSRLQDAKASVTVTRATATLDADTVFTLSSPQLGILTVTPETTLDENDEVYTAEGWETFYSTNTGFNPASGGSGAVVLPTGSRTPVNTLTNPDTQVLWVGSVNTITDTGYVEKTAGLVGWNADANFVIPSMGDFSLAFTVNGSAMAGFSMYDINASFDTIGFALYRFPGGYQIYESGAVLYNVSDTNAYPMRIDFVDNEVRYYINDALVRASVLPNADYTHGHMTFDCSVLGESDTIENIEVTFL